MNPSAGRPGAGHEVDHDRFVAENLRRNYIGNFVHGMLGMTGFRLVNAPTFLPAYLFLVSGSNAIVGLGLALQLIGGIISPLVVGNRIEHRERIMPVAVFMGVLGRLAVLGIALSGFIFGGVPLIGSLLLFIFLFGLFMGAQRVVFFMLIAKVIPIRVRGRLQAWRNATGGLIAAALAYFAGRYFVGDNWLGNGYATTFLVAFVLTSLGLWVLARTIREPVLPTRREETPLFQRLKEMPALVREQPSFGWFLVLQMTATGARMATPFFIIYVGQQMQLDGFTLGLLSLAFLGADTLANLLWGYLGDRTGFRLVLVLAVVLWLIALAALMSSTALLPIALGFCGLGAAQSGYQMGTQTIVLEFGNRDDMPMRIAAATTAESVTATIGPLAGGLIADQFGFRAVFWIAAILLMIAIILLLAVVKEPRVSASH